MSVLSIFWVEAVYCTLTMPSKGLSAMDDSFSSFSSSAFSERGGLSRPTRELVHYYILSPEMYNKLINFNNLSLDEQFYFVKSLFFDPAFEDVLMDVTNFTPNQFLDWWLNEGVLLPRSRKNELIKMIFKELVNRYNQHLYQEPLIF